MSYCRFIEADAYIFSTWGKNREEALTCCGCGLAKDPFFTGPGRFDEMLKHVAEHRAAGQDIPEHVDEDLRADREEEETKPA